MAAESRFPSTSGGKQHFQPLKQGDGGTAFVLGMNSQTVLGSRVINSQTGRCEGADRAKMQI